MALKLYEFTASSTGPSEYLDIALIEVDRSRIGLETSVYNTNADPSYFLATIEQPEISRRVTKTGKQSGVTVGEVSLLPANAFFAAMIDGSFRRRVLRECYAVIGTGETRFSAGDDSGSIIKDDTGAAVDLLFGGIVEEYGSKAVNSTLMTPLTRIIEVCKEAGLDVELPDA